MNLEYGYNCISDVNLEVTAVEAITVTLQSQVVAVCTSALTVSNAAICIYGLHVIPSINKNLLSDLF
jgi:hypothetical protein